MNQIKDEIFHLLILKSEFNEFYTVDILACVIKITFESFI